MKRTLHILLPFVITVVASVAGTGCRNHSVSPEKPDAPEEHIITDSMAKVLADTVDVYARLQPNEGGPGVRQTYGPEKIEGSTVLSHRGSASDNIYVDFDITVLESHPAITADLLCFVDSMLAYHTFIPEDGTAFTRESREEAGRGKSRHETVSRFIRREERLFDMQSPELMEYDRGFNIEFEIYPVFLNDRFVTYRKYASYYTGGAHGNDTSVLHTYSLASGKRLGLTDIVKPESMDKLREHVALHMAVSYPIGSSVSSVEAYLDALNSWMGMEAVAPGLRSTDDNDRITLKNYPLNDPGIHEAGLVFTYGKYHLTPGVNGCPSVLLPFGEIRDCLKEPFCNYAE